MRPKLDRRTTRSARRFPLPWSVEQLDACFIVLDDNGQALAYVYFEDAGAEIGGEIIEPR